MLVLGHMEHVAFIIISTLSRMPRMTLLMLDGAFLLEGRHGALFTPYSVIMFFLLIAIIYRMKLEPWLQ